MRRKHLQRAVLDEGLSPLHSHGLGVGSGVGRVRTSTSSEVRVPRRVSARSMMRRKHLQRAVLDEGLSPLHSHGLGVGVGVLGRAVVVLKFYLLPLPSLADQSLWHQAACRLWRAV